MTGTWIAMAVIAVLATVVGIVGSFFDWRGWFARSEDIGMTLDSDVQDTLDGFLVAFAERLQWSDAYAYKLRAAGEEVVLILTEHHEEGPSFRRLRVSASVEQGDAVLQFLVSPRAPNVEEQIADLVDDAPPSSAQEFSLRLLRHYASSVRHRHEQMNDLVTIRVEGPKEAAGS